MPVPVSEWRKILGGVTGRLVAGEMRVATHELVSLVGAANRVDTWNRLKAVMNSLGWSGPKAMRISGGILAKGYYRPVSNESAEQVPIDHQPALAAPAPAVIADRPVPAAKDKQTSPEELAKKLESVCGLSLDKIEEILLLPTDSSNGNVLRAQTACAGAAVQLQLRADETRLKVKRSSDVFDRLLKIIRQEKKIIRQGQRKIPRAPQQIIPDNTPAAEA
jgi:hypothetical protein